MKHPKYPYLFSPIKINQMIVKNRIYSGPLGSQTDKSVSGIGMIMKGTSGNVIGGKSRIGGDPNRNVLVQSEELDKVKEELSVMRQRGARASFEVLHAGLYGAVNPGDYAVGPCSFTREDGVEVRGMNEKMMDKMAENYAKTSLIIKELGFDMITLHFAHGWLPAQFLSPLWNHRKDEYGGSPENRAKFPTMIVDRVRNAVGPDYPIDMRISVSEYVEGGVNPDDIIDFVASIQGKIDMINISGGYLNNIRAITKSSTYALEPRNFFLHWAELMKMKVKEIPVAVVGAIMTPEDAEEILSSGKADIIVIGRQIIADPFWVKKTWECKSEDIVPCIRCLDCWSGSTGVKGIPYCSVAPRYRREKRVPIEVQKADVRKKVVIVGGGPGGMNAAITADKRGHEVTLIEKTSSLGGQLKCTEYDNRKVDLKRYKDYLVTQIKKTQVHLMMNTVATPELIRSMNPDCIIIAAGAKPTVPPIKGVENENVIQAIDVYPNLEKIGKDVVIIGGGSVGAELALTLSEKEHTVSLVEIASELAGKSHKKHKYVINEKLSECDNVKIYVNTKTKQIETGAVTVRDESGKQISLKADTVVLATGFKPDFEFVNSFFGIVQDTNVIGDSVEARSVHEANDEGYFVAASL